MITTQAETPVANPFSLKANVSKKAGSRNQKRKYLKENMKSNTR